MKKIKHLLFVSIVCLTSLVALSFFYKAPKKVEAATLSSGQYLDINVDTYSLSDLTIGGNTGLTTIANSSRKNTASFTFSENNTNMNIIFKFKYNVTNQDSSIQSLVSFDTGDADFSFNDNNDNSLLLQGNMTGIRRFSDGKYNYKELAKLEIGLHEIEFGRIAVLNSDGTTTGTYYVYLKVDKSEIRSDVTAYDATKMSASMYLYYNSSNSSGENVNTFYDISYNAETYETADNISISDLTYVNGGDPVGNYVTLNENKKFAYTATAAHKSVVFKFKYEVVSPSNLSHQFHFADKYSEDYEMYAGMVWFKSSKTHIRTGNATYIDWNSSVLATAETYNVEIGKLYVTSGDNSGKYYVYLKVEGNTYLEMYADQMADKANIFTTGDNGDKLYDINYGTVPTTYETADEVSINDLSVLGGSAVGKILTLSAQTKYSYTATAEHKSVVYKFKYEVVDPSTVSCQFHFTDGWSESQGFPGGMIWLTKDKTYIRKSDSGYFEAKKAFPDAGTYNVEIGKVYITAGEGAGKYYVYVKVNDVMINEQLFDSMPNKAALFLTGTNGDKLYDINYVAPTYEEADEVSITDLSVLGGSPVGKTLTLSAHTKYSYTATAEHKSVVYKFKYEVADPSTVSCQFHFTDGWSEGQNFPGGMIWLKSDNAHIRKMADGYVDLGSAPFAAAGTYTVEMGKLYITAGEGAGKYYIYFKINDVLKLDYLTDDMPDKAALFLTGTNGDKLYDIDFTPCNGTHTLEHVEAVAPTCTTAGSKEYWVCTNCDECFSDSEGTQAIADLEAYLPVVALGHTFGDWVEEVSATCTTAGTKGHKDCSVCNKHFDAEGNEIADLTINALGHDLVVDDAVDPTCTEAGKTAGHHCSRCDYTDGGETVAALGHDYQWVIDQEATVLAAGSKHEECTRCHDKKSLNTEIPMLTCEHQLSLTAAIDPTCTTAGAKAYYTCSECHKHFEDAAGQLEIADLEVYLPVAALGHQAGETVYHTAEKHFNICTRCGFVLDFQDLTQGTNLADPRWTQRKYTTEWVSMSGQMRVREKDGSTVVNMAAGYSTTMQYIFNFEGTTPIAKGNSFSIDLGNYFGGAQAMGVKVSLVVKIAGQTQTVYVLGDASNYYNFPVTTGLETFTYVSTTEVEIYEIRITNNSKKSDGGYLYMDNLKIFTALNVENHTLVDDPDAPAVAATCTTAGKEAGKMCDCGYKAEGAVIPALGHDLTKHEAVAPTCTTNGSVEYYECSRCHKMFSDAEGTQELDNITVPGGHTLSKVEAVAPTLTTPGNIEYYECSVCHKIFSDAEGTQEIATAALTLEQPKEISISDLLRSGKPLGDMLRITGHTDLTFDNTEHAANYSLIAKFKYESFEAAQNQFHLSNSNNKWGGASSIILNNDGGKKVHLGKSEANNASVGWYDINFTMTVGTTYEIEFGRLAIMNGDTFTSKYYVYLMIDGEIITAKEQELPTDVVQGNVMFMTADGKNTVYDIDYVAPTFEEADEISISDLTLNGEPVGNMVSLDERHAFSYTATAEHKSVIYKFKYNVANLETVECQFHFTDGWSENQGYYAGMMIWLQKDKSYIRVGEGQHEKGAQPFSGNGTFEVELGKLYITSGKGVGTYYVYVKVNGTTLLDCFAESMPDKAALFTTGTNGDYLYDVDYTPCGDTHTLTKVDAVAATCTTAGNIEYYVCSNCGKKFSDAEGTTEVTDVTVPAGHTLTKVEAVAATCTEAGNIEYYECSVCGKKFSDAQGTTEITETTIAASHTLTKHDAVAPTCTTAGNVEYYECSVCGKKFSDAQGTTEITETAIPAAHTLTFHEAHAATCAEEGNIAYYHCSECGKNFSDAEGTVQVTDVTLTASHTLTKVEAKAATCTEGGNVEYYHCSKCGKNYSDAEGTIEIADVTVPATGHKYGTDGKCTVCGAQDPDYKPSTTKKGCRSAIGTSIFVSIALLGSALIVFKKRREEN